MSEKNMDRKGRWRNVTIAFRVSKEESQYINEAVYLSGKTKQEYIVSKLFDREVVVERNPRTYKRLRTMMENILGELRRIGSASECSQEFIETIVYVSNIYERMGTMIKED